MVKSIERRSSHLLAVAAVVVSAPPFQQESANEGETTLSLYPRLTSAGREDQGGRNQRAFPQRNSLVLFVPCLRISFTQSIPKPWLSTTLF